MASENEQEKLETLADIVADIRNRADCAERHGDRETHNDGVAMFLRSIADRIEAVAKRDAAIHAMTCEANERLREHLEIALEDNEKPVGNAAAMREALFFLRDKELSLLEGNVRHCIGLTVFGLEQLCKIMRGVIEEALAEPPRQCDVGTAEEQGDRFMEYCNARKDKPGKCRNCVFNESVNICAIEWAQTPYAEEGGASHA